MLGDVAHSHDMMTSSNGNIFRVTGHLCGEFTGTKASDAELWLFSLICARINSWVNNGEAGELRRHRAHYDVTVMVKLMNAINHTMHVYYIYIYWPAVTQLFIRVSYVQVIFV